MFTTLLTAIALLAPVGLAGAYSWRLTAGEPLAIRVGLTWIAASTVPVLAGAGLSAMARIGSTGAWVLALIVATSVVGVLMRVAVAWLVPDRLPVDRVVLDATVLRRLKLVLGAVGVAAALAWGACLAVLPLSTPWQWDSLTYHLPRVIHAWQVGTFNFGCTGYWAQWMHPWGISSLQLWLLQIVAFHDAFLPLLSVVAALVCGVQAAGLAAEAGATRAQQALALLLVLCAPTVLMQAFTVMPEAPATAAMSVSLLLGLAAARRRSAILLAFSVFAFALACTLKAFVLMALLAFLALWAFGAWRCAAVDRETTLRSVAVAGLLGAALALSTGYGSNLLAYGHPLGSTYVQATHTFSGIEGGRSLEAIRVNSLRFAMEWFTPDGLPTSERIDAALPSIGERGDTRLGAPVIGEMYARHMFRVEQTITPRSQEELSWPGVLAWLITWAVVLGLVRPRHRLHAVLAGCVLYWLSAQVWSGPWDPWRGRYMTFAIVVGAALIALVVPRMLSGFFRFFAVGVLVGLIALSAVHVVVNREGRPLVANIQRDGYGVLVPWPWERDRVEQMTAQKRWLDDAVRSLERVMPAEGEIAFAFHERATPEYIFLGAERPTRRAHWPYCADTQTLELPPTATHLLYEIGAIAPQQGDVRVRRNLILRRL